MLTIMVLAWLLFGAWIEWWSFSGNNLPPIFRAAPQWAVLAALLIYMPYAPIAFVLAQFGINAADE